jgi:hypothetical protein
VTDYYPFLARTVVKVDTTDPAKRQEFYRCARVTLVNALRRRNPEISAASISREQVALQRAIVRLDAELRLTALKQQVTTYLKAAEHGSDVGSHLPHGVAPVAG